VWFLHTLSRNSAGSLTMYWNALHAVICLHVPLTMSLKYPAAHDSQ
jgi:hypothetical protein